MSDNKIEGSIKTFYGNKVIILGIIIVELIFFGFVLFSPFVQSFLYSCCTIEFSENEKICEKIIFFFDKINPVCFLFVIIIFLSFVISIIALFILLIKDDGNIRFVKLKALKEIQVEVKNFEEKLNIETRVKETTIQSKGKNSITTETTHTNYLYEFYKKYMDTLSEL